MVQELPHRVVRVWRRSVFGSRTGSNAGFPMPSPWPWRPWPSSRRQCVLAGNSVLDTAERFGSGFWDLVTFTVQMSMIVVAGYAAATAPPVYAVIRRLAAVPSTGRGAVAYVGLFSMLTSLLSWSFSLIFSGLLAREVANRVKGSDYRAIEGRGLPGVGSVWAWAFRRRPRSSWPRPLPA